MIPGSMRHSEHRISAKTRCHYYTLLVPNLSIKNINRNTYIQIHTLALRAEWIVHLSHSPYPLAHTFIILPWEYSYRPSSSLSKADPGCSSESLPVFTSSEKAGPTPAPGWVTGGTADGSSGLISAHELKGDMWDERLLAVPLAESEEGEGSSRVAIEEGAGVKMREYGGKKNKKWSKKKREDQGKKKREKKTHPECPIGGACCLTNPLKDLTSSIIKCLIPFVESSCSNPKSNGTSHNGSSAGSCQTDRLL